MKPPDTLYDPPSKVCPVCLRTFRPKAYRTRVIDPHRWSWPSQRSWAQRRCCSIPCSNRYKSRGVMAPLNEIRRQLNRIRHSQQPTLSPDEMWALELLTQAREQAAAELQAYWSSSFRITYERSLKRAQLFEAEEAGKAA